MSPLWTFDAIAEATGAILQGKTETQVQGLSIDTRSIAPGDLFIALRDQRDGHDFVADALAKGAVGALVSRRPDGIAADAPLVVVDDVMIALADLARAARARTKAKVVAVTGSVGKTSTKEMLRTVLGHQGQVHAAEASFNNHWGVPLTLARMPEDADFAVIEIGMNAPGEIAPLAKMTQPDVALITTIAPAHLEAFADISGIAREKASIFEGLTPGGVAIYDGDVGTAPILAEAAEAHAAKALAFGQNAQADLRAISIKAHDETTVVEAQLQGTPALFKLGTPGQHFARNALGVLAVVEAVGADTAVALCDIAKWSPPAGRGTRETVVLDAVEDELRIDLIDDAFNANPASLAASLDVLAALEPENGVGRVAKGRRIAILGDMLELGPTERELHAEVADHPAMELIAQVHCVGPRMHALYEALPPHKRGYWVETADALAERTHGLVDAGDIVLVKGSKGSRVSRVVDAIRKLGHGASTGSER